MELQGLLESSVIAGPPKPPLPHEPQCGTGWVGAYIDEEPTCMKNFGLVPFLEARRLCDQNNAKLPTPQTEQANSDYFTSFQNKLHLLEVNGRYDFVWLGFVDEKLNGNFVNVYTGTPAIGYKC